MSNKDEILVDNWEEIDDDGLNTKLEQIRKEAAIVNVSNEMNFTPSECNGNSGSSSVHMLVMADDNDYHGTNYVTREPKVKILKRPTAGDKNNLSNSKPKPPMKSLEQREIEYARARLRILGSACSPDDSEQQQLQKQQSQKQQLLLQNNLLQNSQLPKLCQNNRFEGIDAGGVGNVDGAGGVGGICTNTGIIYSRNTSIIVNNNNDLSQQQNQIIKTINCEAGILRLPKGPDGTIGFKLRR